MERFGKQAVAAILGNDSSGLHHWHRQRGDGIWVVPPADGMEWMTPAEQAIRLTHPLNDLDSPALPFPFSIEQWLAFCRAAPLFVDEHIESQYSNDDGSLDEVALADLARRNAPSAALVQAVLERERAAKHARPSEAAKACTRTVDTKPRRALTHPEQHAEKVLAAFASTGIDPMTIEAAPLGNKPWPLRKAIEEATGLSRDKIRKVMTDLRASGRMRPDPTQGRRPQAKFARSAGLPCLEYDADHSSPRNQLSGCKGALNDIVRNGSREVGDRDRRQTGHD
jgi:hypothetical protein